MGMQKYVPDCEYHEMKNNACDICEMLVIK